MCYRSLATAGVGHRCSAPLHVGCNICAVPHLVSQRGEYTLWSARINQCVLFTQVMIGEHADLLEVTTRSNWKQSSGELNLDNKEKDYANANRKQPGHPNVRLDQNL